MQLTDKIHILRIDFEISMTPQQKIPRFVNVILVFGSKVTLIDTGVKGSEKILFDYIEQQGRDKSEIETIILSHAHPDHIGSAASLKEIANCNVLAHELEKPWAEDIHMQNKQRPVPGFYDLVDKPVVVDGFLCDNETINLGENLTIRVIESPGHSKGSLNILFEEGEMLFTADSIPLKNDIPNYDNYKNLMKSLERIKGMQYKTLLTSWTPPLTNLEEIEKLINDGIEYMQHLDTTVINYYKNNDLKALDSCQAVIEKLGLPLFLVNPIVDKAFRSHFK